MSVRDGSPIHEKTSKTTGTLTGTLTNITTGEKFEITADDFHRAIYHDGPRLLMMGPDPENSRMAYHLDLYFNSIDPSSGTYKVDDPIWKNCIYVREINEVYYFAESGQLTLVNFSRETTIYGHLQVVVHDRAGGRYELDVNFSIVGKDPT